MSLKVTKKAVGQNGFNSIYFMTKKLGLAIPKHPTVGWSYINSKGIQGTDTTAKPKAKNIYVDSNISRQQTGGNFELHLFFHKSKKSLPLNNENQVGLDFMEMEPPWFHVNGDKKLHFSYGQRVLAYMKPTMIGNYGASGSTSADPALGRLGIIGIKKSTSFNNNYINAGKDFVGGERKQSVMGRWATSTIGFSFRGHAPNSDILELDGGTYKVKKPKTPKQPAPKKYVGPQSGKPSTYSATKSALADYTKTFTWKIQQKTKKASYSGKGYTITDTLPGGTTIASITAPKGWTYTKSGNKVTFKATANVYKAAKTYNFYVASQTTKAQAMKHTSFNNHVTSKRKVSSSKWQTKNSNTAKWTLKNEQIKGYCIDFDHHDHAVAQVLTEHVKKVFRRGALGVLPLP
ncbi:hypothetical protein EGT51_03200 [Levilactobacillus suantsaiihabitans]|uniref:Uncharacterized protein n=2 Tax=Levilactobacillus suantsaiihabitans TaxID=2487722 RepID=A0A4Z0JCH1_9LACO|nr:hypothetical protein EGT51_03200 [Levilactobacillus suantsaiihabitans]